VDTDPDLVLAPNASAGQVEALREQGLTVYHFPAATSVEDIAEKTEITGRLVGNCEAAAETNEEMNQAVTDAENRTADLDRPAALYPLGDGFVAGGNTFINEIMQIGGTDNVAAAEGDGYPQLSNEIILQTDPKLILVTDPEASILDEEPYASTTAGVEGNYVVMNVNYLNQPAPRSVIESTETLATAVEELQTEDEEAADGEDTTDGENGTNDGENGTSDGEDGNERRRRRLGEPSARIRRRHRPNRGTRGGADRATTVDELYPLRGGRRRHGLLAALLIRRARVERDRDRAGGHVARERLAVGFQLLKGVVVDRDDEVGVHRLGQFCGGVAVRNKPTAADVREEDRHVELREPVERVGVTGPEDGAVAEPEQESAAEPRRVDHRAVRPGVGPSGSLYAATDQTATSPAGVATSTRASSSTRITS